MVFSDLFFIFCFIPLFGILYVLAGKIDSHRIGSHEEESPLRRPMLWRNVVLTFFSILFYAWGEPVYIFLMLVVVFVNYVCGLLISKVGKKGLQKTWLIIGVAADLAALGSFKYLGFFSGILRGVGLDVPDPMIALPIGISFYIFQSISYLVDVYRKESEPQRNYFDLLLYISMFPQLIAGPIVRYGTVADEIGNRHATADDIADGVYRFTIGLGKKVIIANIMGEIATSLLGGNLDNLSAAGAWVGILAFSIQIYFDFSGYSDMAIGIGRCVGFHFPENFNHPYTCTSMTDFAPLAHELRFIFQGLRIYPDGRQPQASGIEHHDRVVPDRHVARRKLEFHYLGRLFRTYHYDRKVHSVEMERAENRALHIQYFPYSCGMGYFLF